MKSHLIWIFFGVFPLLGAGQEVTSLEKTFYDLPINSTRNKIRTQILEDARFFASEKLDTSFLGFNNNTYLGQIIRYNVPSAFAIDSATLELTWGYGMMKPYKNGHRLTFLKLAYFVSDRLTSDALAKMFWDRHKSISRDTFEVTVGRKEDNNYNYGKEIRLKRKKYLPTLSVLQQEFNNKVFVVRLEYERFGD